MVIFKLNKLLEKENIGQRELSRETGIRQATISDYVNNKAKTYQHRKFRYFM